MVRKNENLDLDESIPFLVGTLWVECKNEGGQGHPEDQKGEHDSFCVPEFQLRRLAGKEPDNRKYADHLSKRERRCGTPSETMRIHQTHPGPQIDTDMRTTEHLSQSVSHDSEDQDVTHGLVCLQTHGEVSAVAQMWPTRSPDTHRFFPTQVDTNPLAANSRTG